MSSFARSIIPALILALAHPTVAAAADGADGKPTWEKSGDLLQFGIPLVGLGLSFLLDSDGHWDWGGSSLSADPANLDLGQASGLGWPGPQLGNSSRTNFLISFVRMEVATYGLKYAIDAERPNGGGQSFPSGHTAAAFMGAEFIRKEYGWAWGAPAYAAASWVGYTRVESDNHYWRDVLGGAIIGVLANHDFGEGVTRGNLADGQWDLQPAMFVPEGGFAFGVNHETQRPGLNAGDSSPGLRFTWRF